MKLQTLKDKLAAHGVGEIKLSEVKAVSKFMWLLSEEGQQTVVEIENKLVAASKGAQSLRGKNDASVVGKKVSKKVDALFEGSAVA